MYMYVFIVFINLNIDNAIINITRDYEYLCNNLLQGGDTRFLRCLKSVNNFLYICLIIQITIMKIMMNKVDT